VKIAIGIIVRIPRTSLQRDVNVLIVCLPRIVLITLLHLYWRSKLKDLLLALLTPQPKMQRPPLTAEDIEIRIWAFVVIMVTLILAGIVFALLYSVTFVVQPIKSMAPIDQAYTKMLNDIVLLIVGGIGGVIGKKGVGAVAQAIAPTPVAAAPVVSAPVVPSNNLPVWVNPPLDEEWRAPPPPTTPPDFIDPSKEEIANERAAARSET
jgi:hypothetical protein